MYLCMHRYFLLLCVTFPMKSLIRCDIVALHLLSIPMRSSSDQCTCTNLWLKVSSDLSLVMVDMLKIPRYLEHDLQNSSSILSSYSKSYFSSFSSSKLSSPDFYRLFSEEEEPDMSYISFISFWL